MDFSSPRPPASRPELRPRLSAWAAQILHRFVHSRGGADEQAIMRNRLLLALLVLLAAGAHAHSGAAEAQNFFRQGMPWLLAYLILTAALQAHIVLRPGSCVTRRLLAIGGDAAVISFGLYQGDAASAYLFPLYFWMILGNGVRLGARYMGAAVVCAAAGFAVTVWLTPFWRANVAFSAGLFVSLIIIPIYGGLLLRRLAEASAEAERANHAKTLLLACVSHELRTPLTAITGLGALLQETALDEEQREMVQTLSGAGAILLRHIEALLTVSRDEMGPAAPPDRCDLFALLVSLRGLLAVEADKKGVRLGLCIEADTPRHIVADPALLLDILQNLVGNAVKFTPSGAVAIHVGVGRRDPQCFDLRVEVLDTGIGVEKAAQERIFDSFVQADSGVSRLFGGSGLGLAIARQRLKAHGGHIGVESDIGKGARFWFELSVGLAPETAKTPSEPAAAGAPLPRAEWDQPFLGPQSLQPACLVAPASFDALALARRHALAAVARDGDPESLTRARDMAAGLKELAAAPAAGDAPKTEPRLLSARRAADARPTQCAGRSRESLRLLLAEDNGVNRMVLDKILTRAGHRTTLVADGEAALEAMLNGAFDVILLDVNMPGISGPEAARLYACALPPERRAPIIALTADAGPACRAQCAEAGMTDFLTKPLTPDALLDAVDAVAPSRKQGQGASAADRPGRPLRPHAAKNAVVRDDLDPAALATLTALGGEAFLRELSLQFIGEGAKIVERMTIAVENGDLPAFQREAHALDSSAGNIGAAGLARLCRSWRDATPKAFALYGDDFLDDLSREWSRAALALNQVLAKDARPSRAQEPRARRGDAAA